ncbi:sugar ABC transporter ATP-binding protein [Microbacteriaceae bacterium VKM Ac-2855]|nr:sugar ABC transporter ATP-binding protein [Microbacteriaceae bacterium VKM Ac-2855]
MSELVRIDGAVAAYGSRVVLRGVDLSLAEGEIVGLIGLNGAGKSTLVRALSGQHRLDAGVIRLSGEVFEPVSPEQARARGVGVLAQNFEFADGMTVARALFRFTARATEDNAGLRADALELFGEAGVRIDPDAIVDDLDRGRQALVEIVRMLAEEARLVIVDEVAVTLADHEIAVVHRVLRRLAARGRSILYVTHRMDEIRSIATRVIVLRDGGIVEDRGTAGLESEELVRLLLGAERVPSTRRAARPEASEPVLSIVGVADDLLTGVDLILRAGEIVGITGTHDSGAGRLLEILGGERRPSSGHIEVDGRRREFASTADARLEGIGYLADAAPVSSADRLLIDGVADEVDTLDAEIRRARRTIEIIRELRISTYDVRTSTDRLSGGDQQKTELVHAIERGGQVFVLAHPTRGVDAGARDAVFELLHRLVEDGAAVLFLGSDMTELLRWSHRVVVVAEGRIVLDADPTDLDEDVLVRSMLGGFGDAEADRGSTAIDAEPVHG